MRRIAPWILAPLMAAAAVAAAAQDSPPPGGPWTTSLGAGLAVTSGNSDSKNFNLAFNTKWDPGTKDVFKAEALYLRGDSNGDTTVDKLTGLGRYERLLTDRTFGFGEVSFLRDPFKDIDSLVAPLVGVGYHIIKTDTERLTVDAGAGGRFEKTSEGSSTDAAVKGGEAWERSLSPATKVTQRLTGLWSASDFGDALYHFDAGLTTSIAARAELKVAYVYDYDNQPPAPGIEKGDSSLFATILFKW